MILSKIIASKELELAALKEKTPIEALQTVIPTLPAPRPFGPALRLPGQVAIIAEAKKASPSKGIIRHQYEPEQLARSYEREGASAISVLTEEKFFLGHPSHLTLVKKVTSIPVLRKDFIIDPFQIYESRVLGADAILLIAAALKQDQLEEFQEIAAGLGLSCLVEVHTELELINVLSTGASIIGINNRNLKTFETDLSVTFKLRSLITNNQITVVSESGIKSYQDILKLREKGVHAALVGEALVRSPDPGAGLNQLKGGRVREGL
ncbi:MAG: Indole-3-glycerol phosphate synthase [Pelotomaculum sp. PtaB.Bin013]|uniref:Indole-3-glycerol phosphate synthase n=1 Tax=Pelotomaculum isophthalicicum JI TaxID=947010 RepID=A0A9X4H2L0_9FIRM|nr:indole-3-glycerol phosphate synthase TrpC [Pelotomaculum isophthalicicum]MDF9407383.1 indole-3-glycerol phosphate synthase TrpC [Pelotomaculum isophthalicicum JI]OPX81605.1 MAG: Indole-3-glycerol phosphate synthase [Pelotomaculum sp. PtaB.Bin013]